MQYWYVVLVAAECMVALAIVAEAYPHRHSLYCIIQDLCSWSEEFGFVMFNWAISGHSLIKKTVNIL